MSKTKILWFCLCGCVLADKPETKCNDNIFTVLSIHNITWVRGYHYAFYTNTKFTLQYTHITGLILHLLMKLDCD